VLDGSPEVLRDVAIVANFGTQSAIIMAALRSRCGHYIFALWFLLSFPRLISAVANLECRCETSAARGSLKIGLQDAKKWPKIRHLGTIAQLCPAISSQLRHIDNRKKILHVSSQHGELRLTNG